MLPPTAPTTKVNINRKRYRYCLLGSLLLSGLSLAAAAQPVAQAGPAATATGWRPLPPDSRPGVRLRQPPAVAERLADLRGQRAFRYVEEKAIEAPPSAWSLFWAQFFKWINRQLSWVGDRLPSGFWDWVLYGALAGAVVFVVLKLLQVDLTAVFGRSPRRAALSYETLAENIHELDFATRLREAEEAGNLRLAVRLGYLQLLKQLSDGQLINWQPNKTNQAYLRELTAQRPALRAPFAELTRQFEYVWYGELPLPPPLYAEVRAQQRALGQQLSGGRRAAVS